jgi:Ca-activated chloride channel family protein
MQFEHPEILFGIFALPLVVLFFWWAQRRRRRLLERFGLWTTVARLIESASPARQALKMGLLVLAPALLIAAFARPQYGATQRTIQRRGLDLLVAIDVSRSMLARDVANEPRIARAKEDLGELIRNARGHRVGIIAFAGNAFVQCPLTLDYGLALSVLDALAVGIVPQQGTSIGRAINEAVGAFERADAAGSDRKPREPLSDRVLLLLTDGEDHDKQALDEAVDRAAKAGVRIFAIGIGSAAGTTIPGAGGQVHRDPEGRFVQTRLDFGTLQEIAGRTRGVAIRGTETGHLDLAKAVEQLNALKQSVQKSAVRTVYEERFVPVLALALLLLVIEMFIGDRKSSAPAAAGEAPAAEKSRIEEAA